MKHEKFSRDFRMKKENESNGNHKTLYIYSSTLNIILFTVELLYFVSISVTFIIMFIFSSVFVRTRSALEPQISYFWVPKFSLPLFRNTNSEKKFNKISFSFII